MEALLVAGAETMVGANFAVQLAETYDVTACFFESPRPLTDCRSVSCRGDDPRSVQQLIADVRPQRIVFCGAGANSAWTDACRPTMRDVHRAELWLKGAQAADVSVTFLSSDAVFTGPWMFHPENGHSLCPSEDAGLLRAMEKLAEDIVPESLVLRCHPFGWSSAWLETLLANLESGQPCRLDCVRHASPILVNDLIDIVVKSWHAGLAGLYHVAGAERTNPAAFAQRLASEFALRVPKLPATASLTDRSSGFGCSETSLQTRKIRRALGMPAPLLSEGLRRLRALSLNGFRDRLIDCDAPLPAKVA